MNKIVKIFVVLAVSLLIICVAAVIIIPMVVNPNDYKPQVEEAVQQTTGRTFQIEGDIELSFFPWLGLRLNRVSLGNAPGFSREPMARIEEADVKVGVIPMLSRQIVVDTCLLKGLQLYLGMDSSGKPNWMDLLEKQAETSTPQQAKKSASENQFSIESINVHGVEVSDAKVTWDDQQKKEKFTASSINMKVTGNSLSEPFAASLSLAVDSTIPDIKAEIALTSQITLELPENTMLCNGTQIDVDLQRISLQQSEKKPLSGKLKLTGDLKADLGNGLAELKDLELATALEGGSIPGEKIDAALAANITLNWLQQTIAVTGLKVDAYNNLSLTGAIEGKKLFTSPAVNGSITIKDFSPKALMEAMALPAVDTMDPKALTKMAANMQFSYGADKASIESLIVQLDDAVLTGQMNAAHLSRASGLPSLTFALNVNALDADRYLPSKKAKKTLSNSSRNSSTPNETTESAGLPVELLKSLDVDGRLKIGKLKVYKISASNIEARVFAKNGRVALSPLSLNIFQGTLNTDAVIDASRKTPLSSLVLNLKQLDLEKTLSCFMNTPAAGGSAGLNLDLQAEGSKYIDMLHKLDGKVSLAALDGYIRGFRLEPKRFDRQKGYSAPSGDVPNLTEFERIGVDFDIKDGLATTRDLKVKTHNASVDGKGSVDLARQRMNMTFDADLQIMVVPISVEGPITNPRINVNTGRILMNTVKGVGSVLEKGVKTGGDVGKGAVDILREGTEGIINLFGGSKK